MPKNSIILIPLIALCLYSLKVLAKDPPYGRLSVNSKGQLVGSNGQQVQLRGISLFCNQYQPEFYSEQVVRAVKCFYNGNIIRAPIEPGVFKDKPDQDFKAIFNVIDGAIKHGIYVMVDWHDVSTQKCGDWEMKEFTNNAIRFFSAVMNKYKGSPNIILEFGMSLVVIGKLLKNIIILFFGQFVKLILILLLFLDALLHLKMLKILFMEQILCCSAYASFYPIWEPLPFTFTTKILDYAKDRNIGIFVSEYGDATVTPNAPIKPNEIKKFWEIMDSRNISYIKWALATWVEPSAPNIGMTLMLRTCKVDQIYQDSCLSDSGKLLKQHMWSLNSGNTGC
uniref:Glycoside hydrolase family 5 domain-containing protein n=2 Tax=Meloidogyne enterolobii TaxID=390850 RepID=A0A6V7WVU3_MELEN|nr:unnamed protein product [Meloidogyne enterolobii]